MKKTITTLTLLLALTLGAMAQNGGMFQRGFVSEEAYSGGDRISGGESLLNLPGSHGTGNDAQAPLGGGALLLIGLGATYLVGKQRREE